MPVNRIFYIRKMKFMIVNWIFYVPEMKFIVVNRSFHIRKMKFIIVNRIFYVPEMKFMAVNLIFYVLEMQFTVVNCGLFVRGTEFTIVNWSSAGLKGCIFRSALLAVAWKSLNKFCFVHLTAVRHSPNKLVVCFHLIAKFDTIHPVTHEASGLRTGLIRRGVLL